MDSKAVSSHKQRFRRSVNLHFTCNPTVTTGIGCTVQYIHAHLTYTRHNAKHNNNVRML